MTVKQSRAAFLNHPYFAEKVRKANSRDILERYDNPEYHDPMIQEEVLQLAEQDIDRWIDAIVKTWNAIGHDAEECYNFCPQDGPMTDKARAEIILDAGHMEMYGGLASDDLEEFNKLPYSLQMEMARSIF